MADSHEEQVNTDEAQIDHVLNQIKLILYDYIYHRRVKNTFISNSPRERKKHMSINYHYRKTYIMAPDEYKEMKRQYTLNLVAETVSDEIVKIKNKQKKKDTLFDSSVANANSKRVDSRSRTAASDIGNGVANMNPGRVDIFENSVTNTNLCKFF